MDARANQLNHYYPDAPVINASGWRTAPAALQALMGDAPGSADIDWLELLQAERNEGVLNFIGYLARQAGHSLADDVQRAVRRSLLAGAADKLAGDLELVRVFNAAQGAGLQLLLIKGEALARTLYPSQACRPSGDFDMLINPSQLALGEQIMLELGYTPGSFEGLHMFGQRTWQLRHAGQNRAFVVDLHWDLSNRRYFRNRLSFETIYGAAGDIAVNNGSIRVPAPQHALLIACVHLAAAEPDMPVDLRWLLDIRLLLDALDDGEFLKLVDEANAGGLIDVIAHYGAMADQVLGPCRHRDRIAALARDIDRTARRRYQRSCTQRWYDFIEYGARLDSWRKRMALAGQAAAYTLRRLGGRRRNS